MAYLLNDMIRQYEGPCECGKTHKNKIGRILSGSGCLRELPALIGEYGAKKPFLLADPNTWEAAGKTVAGILGENGIDYSRYIFSQGHPEPDEASVGSAVMHFDPDCDLVIGIGSGVVNDIGKILSRISGKPYFIAATAPSMDGYASASSSMSRDGVKVSLSTRSADVILGDTDVLVNAPERAMISGLGDMLAKYVSITEWRISHIVNGEYYCERIAGMVRSALATCVEAVPGLLRREPEAVEAVFKGLVLSGVAMNIAGVSRPASGVEHYISHIWDMRALDRGTPADTHGIQCAIGTLYAIRAYETLLARTPDPRRALETVKAFSFDEWAKELRMFVGKGAEAMIALEAKEKKYDPETHAARLRSITEHWDEIRAAAKEELPSAEYIEDLLRQLRVPVSSAGIGIPEADVPMTFMCAKDIRDKYVLPRLAWDLGLLGECAEACIK